MARACGGTFLALGVLAATPAAAGDGGKICPPLEIVKAFGDDFRLVGIGISAEGSAFATAPSSIVRSRFSMVEVDPKTRAVTPYPDAGWTSFNEHGDGKPQWISVQALWVDKSGSSLGAGLFGSGCRRSWSSSICLPTG